MTENFLKNKKLLLVIASLRGGGAERVMVNMANYWVGRGVDITLLTLEDPQIPDRYWTDPQIMRLAVYHPNGSNIFSKVYFHIKRVLGIRQIIKFVEPDAVLSFMTSTNILTILATMGAGIRTVVSERTDPSMHAVEPVWRMGRRYLYKYSAVVIAQTPHIKDWLLSNTKARVQVIPNFIELDIVARCFEPNPLVVAIGRLGQEKGFDLLIRAFSQVVTVHPDWKLLILGDGPDREKLESLVYSLGLTSHVRFAGHVKNPQEWSMRASIAVQPSRYEGFPNALLEVMAQGMAVVASKPAGEMLITNEVNGLLVPSEDIDRLAFAITRLVEQPEFRTKLGREATHVRTRFNQERIMALWTSTLFSDRHIISEESETKC